MRFMIMHATNAHWEAGGVPTPDLIARVGTMLGELKKASSLLAGEGLRPSSEGARLRFSGGTRQVVDGPFEGDNELPAGFSIVRARSLDDAIEWAARQAGALGDVEMDIRPVTEPWDIGVAPRPSDLTTRRYMILRKATAATEAGLAPSAEQRTELSRLIEEATRATVHVATETIRPSRRGRRYKNSRDGVSMFDGPFIESKELLGGYVVVTADSLDDVDRWARLYIDAVGADEVDVRELE
jgi:hypothetical protein